MQRALVAAIAAGAIVSAAHGGILYYVEDAGDQLFMIDSDSLAVTPIGPLGVGGDFGDLAYDPASGTMYGIGGRDNNVLYTISLNTGGATVIGSHGINDMFALGVDGDGNLYGQATSGTVYSINPNDGSATPIGGNGVYPGGFDFNPDTGQMVLLEAGGGQLFTVSLADGSATLLNGGAGFVNDNDVAYDGDLNGYWAGDWNGELYFFDSAFNRSTVLSSLGLIAALEYVSGGCAADINGDGNLNIFDFLAFQTAFGNQEPAGDFNGDGLFNVFDFLAFQTAFGDGC